MVPITNLLLSSCPELIININGDAVEMVEERSVDVRDLRMRYLDWGGNGEPMLTLHGLASSANWYDTVAPHLQNNFRVIAPDQRGHGQTTQAPSGYDWDSLASDAIGLLDQLGIEKAAVLGHSWGGNVAVNVAAKFPERTSSLIMIDGGFFSPMIMPGATWEQFQARLAPRDISGTRESYLNKMSVSLSMCWSDEIARILLTMVDEDENGQIHDILRPEHHAQVISAMWNDPASETWSDITCPTLIVPAGPMPERAGSEFAAMRRKMVEMANEAISDSQVHWVPETIHDIGWHKPKELAGIIQSFLHSDQET